MTTTPIVRNAKSLEKILAVLMALFRAYQDIVALDEPETSALRQQALDGIGKVHRQIARLKKDIAKMGINKGA